MHLLSLFLGCGVGGSACKRSLLRECISLLHLGMDVKFSISGITICYQIKTCLQKETPLYVRSLIWLKPPFRTPEWRVLPPPSLPLPLPLRSPPHATPHSAAHAVPVPWHAPPRHVVPSKPPHSPADADVSQCGSCGSAHGSRLDDLRTVDGLLGRASVIRR